jgi:hypothetical protein
VQSGLSEARLGGIRAGSASVAPGRASHNPLVVGSSPTRPTSGLIPVVGEPWTGLYTDVGGAMFEPSARIWSHRVAAEPGLAYQGVRRDGPDWLLAWLAKSMRDWTTGVAASWLAWHDSPRVV